MVRGDVAAHNERLDHCAGFAVFTGLGDTASDGDNRRAVDFRRSIVQNDSTKIAAPQGAD
jgi:hypothetical protein